MKNSGNNTLEVQSDYKELFELLNENSVKYIVVGAHALAFYGAPRFTGDLDILLARTKSNAQRVIKALDAFGFGGIGLAEHDFIKPDHVVQLGNAPLRVDFITGISGVQWEEAWKGKELMEYGGVNVFVLGKKELVQNKKSTGRMKDKADIEALSKVK